jgi:predicted aldo/keto reductase-like oxidoreductase
VQYRKLGNTGLEVSCIGLGCTQLGNSTVEYGVRLVQRALDLGINYFDAARDYWDAEVKLGLALSGQREWAILSTKTAAKTRDEAWRHIRDSLARLRTDALDNCHLHQLGAGEDLEARLGTGGALEALVEARDQGLIRHIGCTSHRSDVLVEALQRFDFEIILVPMNLVEPEPLAELIPLCLSRGVGITIMKPVATGLLPAPLALKWLLNQPIACAVPGTTRLEELEQNALVGNTPDPVLSFQEQAEVEALQEGLDHVRCRLCGECAPCPKSIPISILLGTDVFYDHYRNMGAEGFRAFPWSRKTMAEDIQARVQMMSAIESCTRCGECEARCPHGLEIMDMLQAMVPGMQEMRSIYRERLNALVS